MRREEIYGKTRKKIAGRHVDMKISEDREKARWTNAKERWTKWKEIDRWIIDAETFNVLNYYKI